MKRASASTWNSPMREHSEVTACRFLAAERSFPSAIAAPRLQGSPNGQGTKGHQWQANGCSWSDRRPDETCPGFVQMSNLPTQE